MKYNDDIFYVNEKEEIKKVKFSERWSSECSYINDKNDNYQVPTNNLFSTKAAAILFVTMKKKLIDKDNNLSLTQLYNERIIKLENIINSALSDLKIDGHTKRGVYNAILILEDSHAK